MPASVRLPVGKGRQNLSGVSIENDHFGIAAAGENAAIFRVQTHSRRALAFAERVSGRDFHGGGIDDDNLAGALKVDKYVSVSVAFALFRLAAEIDRAQDGSIGSVDDRFVRIGMALDEDVLGERLVEESHPVGR